MSNIGILIPGGFGDLITAMSVLKYKQEIFGDNKIVWYCSPDTMDCLKFAPVEIRIWEDFTKLIINKNKDYGQYLSEKQNFSSMKDLDKEYFPAPWMYESWEPQRAGIDYPNISKRIFGVPQDWEWHPYLYFSDEEREMVKDFCLNLPYKKTIMLETGSRSKQSAWNDNMTKNTIRLCREKFGNCNFIFASKGDNSEFFDDKDNHQFFDDAGVVSCSHFTVRRTALVNNYSDLFIGISSGISVATSCWGNKPTPKIQYANTFTCSTVSLANGPIDFIEIHSTPNSEQKYYQTLSENLNRIG